MKIYFCAAILLLTTMGVFAETDSENKKSDQQEEATELKPMQIRAKVIEKDSLPLNLPVSAGSSLGLTVQETPASIDVITRDVMRERGNTTTQQALGNAVGVLPAQCFGLTCFSMRGFAGTTSLPFLYNGLRYPGLALSPRNTFNYERIEVIKGPSSVLHGLGATTGAVNFVTKAADGREEKEVFLAYDSWNTKTVGLGIGGKIADSESNSYRADLSYKGGDHGSYGFVDDTAYDSFHFSGELAFQLTDTLKATLSEEWFEDKGQGYFGTPVVDGKLVEKVEDNNYNVKDGVINKQVNWTRLNLKWTPTDQIKLNNQTYYNNENRFWRNSENYTFNAATGLVDRGGFLHIKHDQSLIGNRLDLSFDHLFSGMRNRILMGYDISKNTHKRTNNSPYANAGSSVDFFDPTPGYFSTTSAYTPQRKTEVLQRAIFVEDYLNVTDRFTVSLSGRRDHSAVDSFNLRTPTANDPAKFSKSYSGNSYRIGALYDLLPSLTVYGQLASSLEPPTQIVTLPFSRSEFDLTRSKQKEVGLKGSLFNGLGEVTLSLFDITRTNVLTRDPLDSTQRKQVGEQSSKGVEFSFAVHPSSKWDIEGNIALLDAQFEEFNDNVGGVAVSREGNLPRDVPEKLANFWLTYRPNADWRMTAGAHLVDKRAADNANTVWMPGYTTYDALIARKLGKGELMLSIRNLTDKFYANHSYGSRQFMLGEPRAAEISWHATF